MRIPSPALLFLAVPLAELVTFGLVVDWIGFWRALGLMIVTSGIGLFIVRKQGFGLISKMSALAREGRPPAKGMGGDLVTILAGVLLLVPGFLTDIAGLLLLLPFVRRLVAGSAFARSRVHTATSYTETYDFGGSPARPDRPDRGPAIVDLDADDFHRDGTGPADDRQRLGRD